MGILESGIAQVLSPRKVICKGPIPLQDFHLHVPAKWWKDLFNPLYLKTDGDVVEDDKITQDEVTMFLPILGNPSYDAHILDLCCGQGRHSIEMSKRGYKNIHGIDQSAFLINLGIARSKNLPNAPQFKVEDAESLSVPDSSMDYVMCLGNSFGYAATTDTDEQILSHIKRILKKDGTLLLDVSDGLFIRQNAKERSWEWIDKDMLVVRERSMSPDKARMISREVIISASTGVLADQFYAERLFDRDTMRELLIKSGFTDVHFHGVLAVESQRNQDLGMMEKRIIVTARKQ